MTMLRGSMPSFAPVRRARERQRRLAILDRVAEAELAVRAPGPAISESQHVPADPAKRLGEVEIALVAGQAVEQDDRRLGASALGLEQQRIHVRPVRADQQLLVAGRMRGVARWIDGHRSGSRNRTVREAQRPNARTRLARCNRVICRSTLSSDSRGATVGGGPAGRKVNCGLSAASIPAGSDNDPVRRSRTRFRDQVRP